MATFTLRAHFNGTHVVLDESADLEPNTKLLVTVIDAESESEHNEWAKFSADGLNEGYGEDEPEYTVANLIEENPTYERR